MSKLQQISWPAPKGEGRHAAQKAGFVAEFFACAKSAPFLAALLILSLLLPTIFMGALLFVSLDPQGNMQNVPAVVVNSDAGASFDGDDRNIGQELCDRLINSNAHVKEGEIAGFDWHFTSSYAQAEEGLNNGSYYLLVHIPEDFSEAVASVPGSSARQTQVTLVFNPALDYGTQQFGQSFFEAMVAGQVQKIQREKAEGVFVRVKTASSSFLTLTNSGLDLSDGLTSAADGVGQLGDGVRQLASGLLQLKEGIDGASSSPEMAALSTALANVGDALMRIGNEFKKDSPEESAVRSALVDAQSSARVAAKANETLGGPLVGYISDGEDSLTVSVERYFAATKAREDIQKTKIDPLLAVLGDTLRYIETLNPDLEKLRVDLVAYEVANRRVEDRQREYDNKVEEFSSVVNNPSATPDEIRQAWAEVQDCRAMLAEAQKARDDAQKAVVQDLGSINLEELASFAAKIRDVIGSADEAMKLIEDYVSLIQDQAKAGAGVAGALGQCGGYLQGVATTSTYMQGSTSQLAEAIGSIYSAVAGSSDSSMLSGVNSLHDGLDVAADTSGNLFDSMSESQQDMKDATKNSDRQAEVLSQPVYLQSKGTVNTFGASVSPFFLLAGLWAGCMVSAVVLNRLYKRRRPMELTVREVVSAAIANVLPLVVVTLIQALLAQAVMHAAFGLQIDHVVAFYAMGALAAVCFAMVIGVLFTLLGIGGLFPTFVLLVLQIALAAAFFPVQATPIPILEIGNWILPLPQAVAGLRVAMRGISVANLLLPVVVLVAFTVVSFAGLTLANAQSVRPAGKHASLAEEPSVDEAGNSHA